ncbi:MAG: hypothetical protein DMG80_19900 [Acidobacteria bacterium]|nr:MAG: hypothetical protein DMG80_19900 [Acidobacteriota bacterium]
MSSARRARLPVAFSWICSSLEHARIHERTENPVRNNHSCSWAFSTGDPELDALLPFAEP